MENIRGIRHYRSDSGYHCIRVHYTADRDKDPATEAGQAWLERSLVGYAGGMRSAAWRREMEIDWDTTGGDLVFPQLAEYEHKIIIPPFDIPEDWDLFASFDYGHRNPSSFHVYAIDYDGNVYVIWEYYKAGVGYRRIANYLRQCPYWARIQLLPIADPSIWAKTQHTQSQSIGGEENEMKSIAQLFAELPEKEAIFFMPGKARTSRRRNRSASFLE